MKKLVKTSALFIVALLVGAAAYAKNNGGPVKAKNMVIFTTLPDADGVHLAIRKVGEGASEVTITNASGDVVMKESLSKTDPVIRQDYNFDGMDDGNYTIEVNNNGQIAKKTVHVYNDENDQKVSLHAE
ncbi:putative secreted protein (Por secretion system target) [Mucilaginibacter yixingensis]|uniref:Putative secreted protein (Por secretion system target) n=1 Tax=Mucilaginibacter yixingensis TaxID=1295612 RepID=A0A2T5JCH3_9SPHI|nr:T9SS type A sorting domain-containing protein [Mucilaginibacter yixingensis]PTQ99461.1 putative secreted protein (Por secretion system target) [Mucilaginibacter yixingensis]